MAAYVRRIVAAFVYAFACFAFVALPRHDAVAVASGAAADRPWLFISDVHLKLRKSPKSWTDLGTDTDPDLMDSFLAEAHAVDRNPPVVVIAGDFVAHHARKTDMARTLQLNATLFEHTFPHAQFVIALGNNDSACGDYAPPVDDKFLQDVAHAWEPLVNRNGASPDFVRRFSHDGSYVATLPVRGLRIVVTNDNFLSLRYNAKCGGGDAPRRSLDTLKADLQSAPPGSHSWVLFHQPPGIDAFTTTHIAHRLLVVPFMRPDLRESLVAMLGDPRSRVSLLVAGHTHKFSFRIVPAPKGSAVPLLLVPSISPVFLNAPSFLRIPVASDGTLGDVTQFAYDGTNWKRFGDLASLGVTRFDVSSLRALVARLRASPALRTRYSMLYEGGGQDEIDPRNVSVYLCAIDTFADAPFEKCVGKSGYRFVTARGLSAALEAAFALVGLGIICVLIVRARRAVGA